MDALDEIRIRFVGAEDADGLVRCFEACYGRTYPDPTFYDAAALRERIAEGTLCSVGAFDSNDTIVGHMGLSVRSSRAEVAEAGHTVVDPSWRGRSLVLRLSVALLDRCRDGGWAGFVHYPTTAHDIMQKLAVAGGGIEMGVLLGTIPAETRYASLRDGADGQRLAVVAVYQPVGDARARQIHAPARYRTQLAKLYEAARLPRTWAEAETDGSGEKSEIEILRVEERQLVHIDVARVGRDWPARLRALLEGEEESLVHIDLPLEDAATPSACEAACAEGGFFAALLPGFPQGDVLRLQRLPARGETWLSPPLASEEARALLEFQKADRAS